MAIDIKPLTPILGAEITGVDLSDLDDESFSAIFDAFVRHSVIFFPDQPALTTEQHAEFAQRFGEIHVHPFERLAGRTTGDKAGVLTIRTTAESTVAAGNRWHSDVSCDDAPPQASILQLHEIPDVGGDTLFASLYAAYEALSEPMKHYLDGLTAHHTGEEAYRKVFKVKTLDPSATWPEVDHPIVRRHADSGRPVLYVDREFTHSINDLPKEEGRYLLAFLLDHTERVDFQCRFRWRRNAVAVWDNRCVLHHAMWDYWPNERRGHRISVVGERPAAWRLGHDDIPADDERATVKLTI